MILWNRRSFSHHPNPEHRKGQQYGCILRHKYFFEISAVHHKTRKCASDLCGNHAIIGLAMQKKKKRFFHARIHMSLFGIANLSSDMTQDFSSHHKSLHYTMHRCSRYSITSPKQIAHVVWYLICASLPLISRPSFNHRQTCCDDDVLYLFQVKKKKQPVLWPLFKSTFSFAKQDPIHSEKLWFKNLICFISQSFWHTVLCLEC